jgi:hypothetical protein
MPLLQVPEISQSVAKISQQYYGDHTLDAISGAGQIKQPNLALVFINPTHRNISTSPDWNGLKAPWIGCANIWQLFADAGLIKEEINQAIQAAKTNWSEQFALDVYSHAANQGLYITNIVKWAGLDATLPEREKIRLYAPLLVEELRIVQPKRIIAFGQLTFDSLLRELEVKTPEKFGAMNEATLNTGVVQGIQTEIGEIIPCYFPVGQGIKNRAKAVELLKLSHM